MGAKVKDPVCGMEVDPTQFETTFEALRYAFCSEQCRQRFGANPHLYIGVPGERAPRQKGVEVLKRRRFQVDARPAPHEVAALTDALGAMMGVRAVEVEGDTVAITYDLLQATANQLEAKMAEVGVKLGEGWAERLRRGFVHYTEECEVGNLEFHPRHG